MTSWRQCVFQTASGCFCRSKRYWAARNRVRCPIVAAGSLPSGLYWRLAINQANAASIAPAAPKVWPVDGLLRCKGCGCQTLRQRLGFPCCRCVACRCVQIDPADLFRFQAGFIQSGLKGLGCTQTVGAGRRHMVGIATCTIAQQTAFRRQNRHRASSRKMRPLRRY